jgi:hypothetical protein
MEQLKRWTSSDLDLGIVFFLPLACLVCRLPWFWALLFSNLFFFTHLHWDSPTFFSPLLFLLFYSERFRGHFNCAFFFSFLSPL